MTKTNTLVSKVFKAKYFLKGSFLEVPQGTNSDFVWRSLWEAKHVIQEGVIWAIGDGANVLVF